MSKPKPKPHIDRIVDERPNPESALLEDEAPDQPTLLYERAFLGLLGTVEIDVETSPDAAALIEAAFCTALAFVISRQRRKCKLPIEKELRVLTDRILWEQRGALRDFEALKPAAIARKNSVPAPQVRRLIERFNAYRRSPSSEAARAYRLKRSLSLRHRYRPGTPTCESPPVSPETKEALRRMGISAKYADVVMESQLPGFTPPMSLGEFSKLYPEWFEK